MNFANRILKALPVGAGFSLLLLVLLASMNPANAQSVQRVSGTPCVGVNQSFIFQNITNCANVTWQPGPFGTYTIISQSNASITVRWNSPTGNANVVATYANCSSGSPGAVSSGVFDVTNGITPAVALSGPSTKCNDSSPVTFTATPTNGGSAPYYQWLINGNGVSGGTSNTYTRSSFNNNDVIQVRMTSNAQACFATNDVLSNSITMTLTQPVPVSVSITGTTQLCQSDPPGVGWWATAVNGGSNPYYQWYKNGVAVNDNLSSGNQYTPSNPASINNQDQIKVILHSSMSCRTGSPATSNTIQVTTVATVATPSLSAVTTRCQGSGTTQVTASASGATGYFSWNISPPTAGTINASGLVSWYEAFNGIATVSVRANGCNGPSAPGSIPITVTPSVGAPSTPSGPTVRCQGAGTSSYTSTAVNATGYNWSVSPLSAGTINNQGVITWDPAFYGLATISISASGCNGPTTAVSRSVTVTPSVTLNHISMMDPLPICQGASGTSFSAANGATNATGYEWSLTNAGSSVIFPSGGIATINWAANYTGTATVSARALGCNGPTEWKSVSVTIVASVATPALSAVTTRCQGTGITQVTATASGSTGYTWSISPPTAGTINTSGTVTWYEAFTGIATVSATAQGCNGPSQPGTLPITVTPYVGTPSPPTGLLTRCRGAGTNAYSATASNATGYNWSIAPESAGVISASGVVSWSENFFGTATIVVTANGCSGPSAPRQTTVVVQNNFTATVHPAGTVSICSTCTQTLSANPLGAMYTYQWLKNGTPVLDAFQSSLETSEVGEYRVIVDNGTCNHTSELVVIVKNIPPVVHAGPGHSIAVSPNPHILTGTASDADGVIESYSWTQVSGPSVILSGTDQSVLTLLNMGIGSYIFRFGAQDSFGETVFDDVSIDVVEPTNNFNYIRRIDVNLSGQKDVSAVTQLATGDKTITTDFFDGLGRLLQNVAMQGSPLKKDIVLPVDYDEAGRERRKYLPFASQDDGWYRTVTFDAETGAYTGVASDFYNNNSMGNVAQDGRPFSETEFEASPLNRPLKDLGPGQAWHDNSKKTEHLYLTNVDGPEKIVAWTVDESGLPVKNLSVSGVVSGEGFYPTGALKVTSTKDEHGGEVRVYISKSGKVLLKKIYVAGDKTDLNDVNNWAQTYYIYDESGNLVIVLSPEAVKAMETIVNQN